jgi:hypothetical protein
MLHALILVHALAVAAQDAPLEIANARATHGYLGSTYPQVEGRLAGDIVHFTFDVKNLKLDELGRASYSMLVEVSDTKGNLVFKLGPTNAIAQNYLGGNSMPCSAHLEIPADTPAGDYLFKVTVTDRTASKTATFERKGRVLPPSFGLIRVAAFADRETRFPASSVGVVGESLYLSFAPIGFARAKGTKQPDLHVSLRVLDDKGQPTLSKPLSGVVNQDVPTDVKLVPMQFGITINRIGNFTIEITADDKIAGKSAKVTLPLKVVAAD